MNTTGRSPGGMESIRWYRSSRPAGDVDTEHADHEVDRTGGAVAGKDHRMFVGGSDAASNDAAGVLTEPCGLQSGARRLRVGVGIEREDLIPDEVLDELQ